MRYPVRLCFIFFCAIGNFISYRTKKDAPLWMRTSRLRQSEITRKMAADATALGASVCQAHTFLTPGILFDGILAYVYPKGARKTARG